VTEETQLGQGDESRAAGKKSGVAVTAKQVVDVMDAEQLAAFCRLYDAIGRDDDFALEAFKEGYGEGPPCANEVFVELVSRC
jgi:hypothetical protein